jgi:hypothetical protein
MILGTGQGPGEDGRAKTESVQTSLDVSSLPPEIQESMLPYRNGEWSAIERFSAFLKVIRGLIARTGGQTETLWDDTSFHYSRKAYVLIYRAENLMRRLIAHFMLITVGKEWVTETAPAEFREAVSKSKRKADSKFINVLHTVDFIHLAAFLLRPYSRKTTQELYNKIKTSRRRKTSAT